MDPLWIVVVPRQLVLYFEGGGKESLETCKKGKWRLSISLMVPLIITWGADIKCYSR